MSQGEDRTRETDGETLEDLALAAVNATPPVEAVVDAGPLETMTARADRLRLSVPERLRLFQTVCRAVQAEHRRGRVFGDLSPERLAVTGTGEPSGFPPGTSGDRGLGSWTSPEQVLGEPATTSADVYALGTALYELLTGRPPIAVDAQDPDAARAICEQAPERPGRAAPPERRRAIRGDLDAIVLEALRKEPERRYAAAAALADDLDAYLDGLPVRAGRTSEWGRVRRFLRRRPGAVAALVGAFAATIAWGGWEAGRVRALRRDREALEVASRSTAEAFDVAVDRLVDESADGDADAARRAALEGARAYYDARLHGVPADARADAVTRVAMIDRALGRKANAVAGYRTAVEEWKRLAAGRLGDAALAGRLADARVGLARALDPKTDGPDADAALESLTAAGETYLALADREPQEPSPRRRLALVFRDRAEIEHRLKRERAAVGSARQAVRLLEELGWAEPGREDLRLELASAYGLLGRLLSGRDGSPEAAVMALDRAIGILDAATGPMKDSPRVGHDTAARLVDLAEIQVADGSFAPATISLTRAVKILEELSARHPAVADYRGELAVAYNLQAEVLRGRGRRDEAAARAGQARTMLERLVAERPGEARFVAALAASRQLLGRLAAQGGRLTDALKAFQSAIDALEGMKDADRTGADAYALACNLSLGLTLIGAKDGGRPIDDPEEPSLTPADRARRELYARRAVDSLRQAVDRGFDDRELYRRDPALDSLRSRDDFKKLIEKVVARSGDHP